MADSERTAERAAAQEAKAEEIRERGHAVTVRESRNMPAWRAKLESSNAWRANAADADLDYTDTGVVGANVTGAQAARLMRVARVLLGSEYRVYGTTVGRLVINFAQ